MKKLILILIAGSLFAQNLPPQSEIREMTTSEKMMLYNMNIKSPARAVTYSFLLGSSGHAYAGNWKRGQLFLASEIGILGLSIFLFDRAWANEYCQEGELKVNYLGNSECWDYNNPSNPCCSGTDPDPKYNTAFNIVLATLPIVYFWDKIDAGKEVKKYNNKLYKSIFGKEPTSIGFKLQPTYQGANLTMSYSLD